MLQRWNVWHAKQSAAIQRREAFECSQPLKPNECCFYRRRRRYLTTVSMGLASSAMVEARASSPPRPIVPHPLSIPIDRQVKPHRIKSFRLKACARRLLLLLTRRVSCPSADDVFQNNGRSETHPFFLSTRNRRFFSRPWCMGCSPAHTPPPCCPPKSILRRAVP